jgi:hypothetical protein
MLNIDSDVLEEYCYLKGERGDFGNKFESG